MADAEHYVRLAQSILDDGVDRMGRALVNPERERPDLCESELLERFLSDARRLARSYVRLLSWLEQAGNRKAGVLGGKRGQERLPRRPRRQGR